MNSDSPKMQARSAPLDRSRPDPHLVHAAWDTESDSYGASCPRDRDTINELLDPVLPDNPRPNLKRCHRGGHWQLSQLRRLEAAGLTLRKTTLVHHQPSFSNTCPDATHEREALACRHPERRTPDQKFL